jgi:hypothetical protein
MRVLYFGIESSITPTSNIKLSKYTIFTCEFLNMHYSFELNLQHSHLDEKIRGSFFIIKFIIPKFE